MKLPVWLLLSTILGGACAVGCAGGPKRVEVRGPIVKKIHDTEFHSSWLRLVDKGGKTVGKYHHTGEDDRWLFVVEDERTKSHVCVKVSPLRYKSLEVGNYFIDERP